MSIELSDDMGCRISLEEAPKRIVSLVPSLSETIVHLGALDRLAGVTDYCIHPVGALSNVPRVGGTKNPSIDKILSLAPDMVIANAEENEKDHIDELRKHTRVFVTFPRTVEGALRTVLHLGRITDSGDKAEEFVEDCRHFLASCPAARTNRSKKAPPGTMPSGDDPGAAGRFPAVCLVWREPWIAAGTDTYISDLLRTFGFVNVVPARKGRYPKIALEELVPMGPEIILLPDEPFEFREKHREELERFFAEEPPATSTVDSPGEPKPTPLRKKPGILLVDGTMLAWFGWRTRKSFDYLFKLRQSIIEKDNQGGLQ